MQRCVLALDQGTTSSRALIVDHSGNVCATAQKEFRQHYPRPGWVEHDPIEIWSSQASVAAEALAIAGSSVEIAAIGITNQRETTILWDRQTGKPVHPAIVWQDRRTAEICERLKNDGMGALIQQKTGLVIDAYFSATKIQWLLDHVEGARDLAGAGRLAFGTVDTWLIWKLTEGKAHVTDVSNASRTMLYNIHTLDWDNEILDLLRIPRSILPEVRSSSEVVGHTSPDVFTGKTPISGIAGDQQAALFGQLCIQPGLSKNTYGTGCFLMLNTGAETIPSKNNLLTTIAWKIGDRTEYALEGSVFVAGAVVQWLRDELGLITKSKDVEALAQSVPDNGGVYVVPAFAGLGAPHWDPTARGTIVGLTRGAKAGHIARAALESIAYQTHDVLRAMEADSGLKLRELRVDGGATANNGLMQFQSDILGVPLVRPRNLESTAMGAAYLAGLAVGFWKDRQEIAAQYKIDHTFTPSMDRNKVDSLIHGWHRALERAKHWVE